MLVPSGTWPIEERPTHADVVDALGPDHPRLVKPLFGMTRSPHLLQAVVATTRHTAVVVGLETDVCVGTKGLAYEWIRSVDRLALLPGRAPAGIEL